MQTHSSYKTPKGTPPMPTRRNTKAKRFEYGEFLRAKRQKRVKSAEWHARNTPK